MSKHRTANHDFGTLAEDARALMVATADVAGDKVEAARKRLEAALENGAEVYDDLKKKAAAGIETGDEFIRSNPYGALGIGLGIGVVVGFLVAGRK
jgi:ElaB/YqjD/DUF883 family membrane-anchored ribosome-binding protein